MEEAVFCLRNMQCTWYCGPLNSGQRLPRSNLHAEPSPDWPFPILRFFGRTPAGQSACMDVSGAFPYVLVPSPVPHPDAQLIQRLAQGLEQGLTSALGSRNATDACPKIFDIRLCYLTPFYGYAAEKKTFLRILFMNPLTVKKASELLETGQIISIPWQPHEVHIPFIMQFFVDHNIYGMDNIYFRRVEFRKKKEWTDTDPMDSFRSPSPKSLSQHIWTEGNTVGLWCSESAATTCDLELRADRRHVLNPAIASATSGVAEGRRSLRPTLPVRPSFPSSRYASATPSLGREEEGQKAESASDTAFRDRFMEWLRKRRESASALSSQYADFSFLHETGVGLSQDSMSASMDESALVELLEGMREERLGSQRSPDPSPQSLPLCFSQELDMGTGEEGDVEELADEAEDEDTQLLSQSVSLWIPRSLDLREDETGADVEIPQLDGAGDSSDSDEDLFAEDASPLTMPRETRLSSNVVDLTGAATKTPAARSKTPTAQSKTPATHSKRPTAHPNTPSPHPKKPAVHPKASAKKAKKSLPPPKRLSSRNEPPSEEPESPPILRPPTTRQKTKSSPSPKRLRLAPKPRPPQEPQSEDERPPSTPVEEPGPSAPKQRDPRTPTEVPLPADVKVEAHIHVQPDAWLDESLRPEHDRIRPLQSSTPLAPEEGSSSPFRPQPALRETVKEEPHDAPSTSTAVLETFDILFAGLVKPKNKPRRHLFPVKEEGGQASALEARLALTAPQSPPPMPHAPPLLAPTPAPATLLNDDDGSLLHSITTVALPPSSKEVDAVLEKKKKKRKAKKFLLKKTGPRADELPVQTPLEELQLQSACVEEEPVEDVASGDKQASHATPDEQEDEAGFNLFLEDEPAEDVTAAPSAALELSPPPTAAADVTEGPSTFPDVSEAFPGMSHDASPALCESLLAITPSPVCLPSISTLVPACSIAPSRNPSLGQMGQNSIALDDNVVISVSNVDPTPSTLSAFEPAPANSDVFIAQDWDQGADWGSAQLFHPADLQMLQDIAPTPGVEDPLLTAAAALAPLNTETGEVAGNDLENLSPEQIEDFLQTLSHSERGAAEAVVRCDSTFQHQGKEEAFLVEAPEETSSQPQLHVHTIRLVLSAPAANVCAETAMAVRSLSSDGAAEVAPSETESTIVVDEELLDQLQYFKNKEDIGRFVVDMVRNQIEKAGFQSMPGVDEVGTVGRSRADPTESGDFPWHELEDPCTPLASDTAEEADQEWLPVGPGPGFCVGKGKGKVMPPEATTPRRVSESIDGASSQGQAKSSVLSSLIDETLPLLKDTSGEENMNKLISALEKLKQRAPSEASEEPPTTPRPPSVNTRPRSPRRVYIDALEEFNSLDRQCRNFCRNWVETGEDFWEEATRLEASNRFASRQSPVVPRRVTGTNRYYPTSSGQFVKRGRGRPRGSRNKPRYDPVTGLRMPKFPRSYSPSSDRTSDSPRRGRKGRPKGSLNKKTLLRLQQQNLAASSSVSWAQGEEPPQTYPEVRARSPPPTVSSTTTLGESPGRISPAYFSRPTEEESYDPTDMPAFSRNDAFAATADPDERLTSSESGTDDDDEEEEDDGVPSPAPLPPPSLFSPYSPISDVDVEEGQLMDDEDEPPSTQLPIQPPSQPPKPLPTQSPMQPPTQKPSQPPIQSPTQPPRQLLEQKSTQPSLEEMAIAASPAPLKAKDRLACLKMQMKKRKLKL